MFALAIRLFSWMCNHSLSVGICEASELVFIWILPETHDGFFILAVSAAQQVLLEIGKKQFN